MSPGLFSLFKKQRRQSKDDMTLHTSTRPPPLPNAIVKTYGGGSSDPNRVADAFGRLSLDSKRSDDPQAGSGSGKRPQDGRGRGQGRGQGRHTSGPFVGGFNQPPYFPDPHAMQVDGAPVVPPRRPTAPQGMADGASPLAFPEAVPYLPSNSASTRVPMPVPQTGMSLTMQYAMVGNDAPLGTPPPPPPLPPRKDDGHGLKPPRSGDRPRPHSDSGAFPLSSHKLQSPPTTPQRRPALQQTPNSAPAKPGTSAPTSRPVVSPLQTPSKRPRAASSPPSPASSCVSNANGKGVIRVQCNGVTKTDKRCTRKVQVSVPLSRLNGEDLPHYCHQHLKGAFQDKKFHSHKDRSIEVFYEEWVPEYLQDDTQDVLREQMRLQHSDADEPGYIYAFEIDDPTDPDVFHIKVGRAVKLTKRLAEWDKQCQSKQTHLRGFWPSTPEADAGNLARGRVKVGDPGPYCHRVEKLVHLELADLALNAPYLDPGFPDVKGGNGSGNGRAVVRAPCPDCGTVHKEIFSFQRAKGEYKGKEWEEVVKPVIEKWGLFVQTYV